MVGVIVLTVLVRAALWSLLIVFGFWVSRRVHLRSVPWLAAYLLAYVPLHLVLGEIFSRRLLPDKIGSHPAPFNWSIAELVVSWNYAQALLGAAIHLLLALLILADVAFLLARDGTALEWRPAGSLLAFRRHSALVGMVLVGLMALLPLAFAALWFA